MGANDSSPTSKRSAAEATNNDIFGIGRMSGRRRGVHQAHVDQPTRRRRGTSHSVAAGGTTQTVHKTRPRPTVHGGEDEPPPLMTYSELIDAENDDDDDDFVPCRRKTARSKVVATNNGNVGIGRMTRRTRGACRADRLVRRRVQHPPIYHGQPDATCAEPLQSENQPSCLSNSEDEDKSDSGSDDEDDVVLEVLPSKLARKVQPVKTSATKTTANHHELRSLGLERAGFSKSRQKVSERTNHERFSASYGVSADTCEKIFADLKKMHPNLKELDFLMGMDTLKQYSTEHNMAGRWKCHEQTYREKWKEVVTAIADLHVEKIKFDPSDFPEDQIFLLTVDGVNFSIREPRVKNPGSHWYDHKTNSAGVSYLVAIDVRRSRICWIDGPRPGRWCFYCVLSHLYIHTSYFKILVFSFSASASESVTFNGGRKKDKDKDPNCLANKIPEGKKVLADSGLKGSKKASTRMPGNSHKVNHFRARAQGRQESLFKRFKDFGILRQRFRHDFELHKIVLLAVAVIVQYDMENGHPLFDV